MATPFARKLAAEIVGEHFGPQVQKVCSVLIRRGPTSLADLARHSLMLSSQLRTALLVLIQQNCVQPFRAVSGEDDATPLTSSSPTLYAALPSTILPRLSFPRFIQLTADSLGPDAAAVIEGLLEHGRLSLEQMISRAAVQVSSQADAGGDGGDANAAARISVRRAVSLLVKHRLMEQCPTSAEPSVDIHRNAGGDVSKSTRTKQKPRAALIAAGYFESEESRILSAARCPEPQRFFLPAGFRMNESEGEDGEGWLGGGYGSARMRDEGDGNSSHVGANGETSGKRKRHGTSEAADQSQRSMKRVNGGSQSSGTLTPSQTSSGQAVMSSQANVTSASSLESSVLWRVNYDEFLRRFRNQAIVKFISDTIDPGTSIVVAAMLDAETSATQQRGSSGTKREALLRSPFSTPMSTESVMSAVRSSIAGRTFTLERVRSSLQLLLLHPLGLASRTNDSLGAALYTLQLSRIVRAIQLREVETVIRQRFGLPACRIFRLLQQKVCLEQRQVAEMSMLPPTDARHLLYRLLKEELVHLQEVPKTADHAPQRTFFLWRVNPSGAILRLLDDLCKAASNLKQRLQHELEREHEVLSLLESIQAASANGVERQLALSTNQRQQLERIRRVAAVLESSLLKLNDSIMCFSSF